LLLGVDLKETSRRPQHDLLALALSLALVLALASALSLALSLVYKDYESTEQDWFNLTPSVT
jgi:hypothetical protein